MDPTYTVGRYLYEKWKFECQDEGLATIHLESDLGKLMLAILDKADVAIDLADGEDADVGEIMVVAYEDCLRLFDR